MANIDNTTLWSDNPEKFDEITRNLKFSRQRDVWREPGKIHAGTAWGVPVDEIQRLADQNPDMTFYAKHSFEHSWHDTIYTVEYKAGEKERVIQAEPSYMTTVVPDEIKAKVPCYEELEKKLMDVFRRLDVEVTNENGDKGIDFVDADVTVTVEHDGYRMQAKKYFNNVDEIKVFEARKIEDTKWVELAKDEEWAEDCPF
jgi:hypothetical protein